MFSTDGREGDTDKMVIDAYRVYSRQRRDRDFETSSYSRYVLPPTTNPRTPYERRRACGYGGVETARCGCGNGVESFVYGDERGREDECDYDYELRIGMHRKERED
jgi:hypothetical protein